jgi:hypothetical protein
MKSIANVISFYSLLILLFSNCSKEFPAFPALYLLVPTPTVITTPTVTTPTTTPTVTTNPSITLSNSGTTITSSSSFDFGNIRLKKTYSNTFKIENPGTSDLLLTASPAITISGDTSSEFTITQPTINKITAGASVLFDINVNPIGTPGIKSVIVTIVNNSSASNFQFTLKAVSIPDKYIFLTVTGRNGNMSGVTGADTICATEKTTNYSSLLGTTYKAMIVDASNRKACTTANCSGGISENLNWVLLPLQTYYLATSNAAIFTTTSSGITTFPITSAVDTASSKKWWTGLSNDWRTSLAADTCSNWTATGAAGEYGQGSVTTSQWIAFPASNPCSNLYSLICVEQ